MISAEVPVMFSKALEMFITELSLSAWLQTEEAKRRTVQVCTLCCVMEATALVMLLGV